ncbi:MAG: ABC transporter ATP-binding protein [Candidatus Omnitrophica bacterium]|nr:ABC transporter ATP-binding protein [Candidatus Omnitrophota bacterium]
MSNHIDNLVRDQRGKTSFFNVFCEIFSLLPASRKKQFLLILTYMVFVAIVGTISAGSIALFAAAFSSPEETLNSKYILMAQEIFPVEFLQSPKGILTAMSLLMVSLVGIKNALDCLLLYFVARFGAAIEAYFGVLLLKGFLHMPYEWHLNRNSADIVLALQWRSYIGHSFFNTALKTMSDMLLVFFLMLAVFVANPYIAIMVFTLSGIIAYLIYNNIHHLQEREAQKCREYGLSINRQVTKGIHGIKDVKVSGETSFLLEFEKSAYNLARIQGMRSFFGRLPIGLLETAGFAALSGSIIFMLFFTASSALEVTAVISLLIVVAWRILPAISRIMVGFVSYRNILPYLQSQMDYLHEIESSAVYPITPESAAYKSLRFDKEIQVKDLHFVYQDRNVNVLQNIDFCIKKGQTVGIVGCSGVGKSTLIDIVIGLLSPNHGHIAVDGQKLDEQNLYAWMKKLSYVPQTPYICDGSIAENIAFGVISSEIDRDFVMECCRMAYMQDVVDSLPQGIDTVIGERGMRLSGGQRQRVAIARALYTKPELMIFDEATSSLDSKSESAIQETIGALKGSKTLIIVAHRLGTVEKCDALVWLDKGGVKMFGSPENVLGQYEESLK